MGEIDVSAGRTPASYATLSITALARMVLSVFARCVCGWNHEGCGERVGKSRGSAEREGSGRVGGE